MKLSEMLNAIKERVAGTYKVKVSPESKNSSYDHPHGSFSVDSGGNGITKKGGKENHVHKVVGFRVLPAGPDNHIHKLVNIKEIKKYG